MTVCLDTDVLVDCLRGLPQARAWLEQTSGLSIPDCLVAAMALERTLTLCTFNLKHYRVVRGLNAVEPYRRS